MVKETFLMDNNEVLLLIVPTFYSAEVEIGSLMIFILFPNDISYTFNFYHKEPTQQIYFFQVFPG